MTMVSYPAYAPSEDLADPDFYATAVTQGAELLDSKYPGWERRVDLSNLVVGSLDECVACQASEKLFVAFMEANDLDYDLATSYGFMAPAPADPEANFQVYLDKIKAAFEALQVAWEQFIKQRFEIGVFSDD